MISRDASPMLAPLLLGLAAERLRARPWPAADPGRGGSSANARPIRCRRKRSSSRQ